MTTPEPKETPLQATLREHREAQARLQADLDADPMRAAMRAALKLTKVEQEMLAKAEARLTEAEETIGRIVGAIQAAEAGKTVAQEWRAPDGRSLIKRILDPKATEEARRDLPELRADLVAAKAAKQAAHTRRNQTLANINAARNARRRAAKVAHMPALGKAESRSDPWTTEAMREKWAEGKAA